MTFPIRVVSVLPCWVSQPFILVHRITPALLLFTKWNIPNTFLQILALVWHFLFIYFLLFVSPYWRKLDRALTLFSSWDNCVLSKYLFSWKPVLCSIVLVVLLLSEFRRNPSMWKLILFPDWCYRFKCSFYWALNKA